MNDRDPLLDQRLQDLLDDRHGAKRDAGLRASTLDPDTRRALGAYKAVYRALREPPPSRLPDDFAARVAAAAGYAPAPREAREWAPWQVAAAAGAALVALSALSLAAIAEDPARWLTAFDGPLGPLTVSLLAAVVLDQVLATRRATHG